METKQAYKQAYGQLRSMSKQGTPDYTLLDKTYGWKAADRAIDSLNNRNLPPDPKFFKWQMERLLRQVEKGVMLVKA